MQYTLPSYYEVGSCSDSYNFDQQIMLLNSMEEEKDRCVSPTSMAAEAKAIAANKSHSEAERRRRKRINAHLATLRTLLPNTIKTDKASLLAEAVRCVRDLKNTTTELAAMSSETAGNDVVRTTNYMFPGETDELKLSYCEGDTSAAGNLMVALCCDDRPEIITELGRALKSVEGKVVRAEMATVGGRIKCVLWVHVEGLNDKVLAAARTALKVVVDRSDAVVNSSHHLPGNKRPRLFNY